MTGGNGADLRVLLAMGEDELYAALAQIDGDGLDSFGSAVNRGRAVIDSLHGRLHDAICVEWDFCARRKTEDFDDDLNLGVALLDVILAAVGHLPVGIVTALIVKSGLRTYCSCAHV